MEGQDSVERNNQLFSFFYCGLESSLKIEYINEAKSTLVSQKLRPRAKAGSYSSGFFFFPFLFLFFFLYFLIIFFSV